MARPAGALDHEFVNLPILVGRSSERRLLRRHLAASMDGHGRLVLIGGEAGIGKTTLTRDLARDASARDAIVLAGHCYDLTATPPYGPWLDLAARYRPDHNLPPLPPALAEGGIERISSQAALFAEVRAFLAAVAAVRPTLIVLEDLHWADPASLDLLRHVGRQVASLPLLLIVTYRAQELTRRHPFYRQLPALIRDADAVRIDLRRLDPDDLRALVATRCRLPTADEDRLVAYLERHAEGNPFFATELIRTLVAEGLLRPGGDGWVLGALDHVAMPPLLRQVIDGRVARLGDDTRGPLAMAAVIGQEAPLDLWAAVSGLQDHELLAIVEHAVDAHLLEAAHDGTRVRFVHALTREALYEDVLPPRRRLWHCQVGETLAGAPNADPDAVAYHFQQAGDPRAWEWLVQAGERAQRAYAWLTATERLAAAAALLDGVAGREQTRGWLLYRCGRLQRYSRPAAGIADLAEAERLATAVGDASLAADARYSRGLLRCFAGDFGLGLADMAAGIDTLEALHDDGTRTGGATAAWLADALPANELTDAADTDPAAATLAAGGTNHRRGSLPWFLAAAGCFAEARQTADAFLDRVATAPPPGKLVLSAVGHAHHGLGIVHAALGRPDEARQAFARAREVYRGLDHHAVIAFTLLGELRDVVLPYRTDRIAERRRLAAEAEEALNRAVGALPAGISSRRASLGMLFLEGRWAEAREVASEDIPHGNYYLRRDVSSVLGPLARHQAEPDLAWTIVRSVLPDGPTTEPGGCVFVDALLLQRLAIDLAIDAGDLAAARAWLEANDRWLAWSGSVLGRADGRLAWARYHEATGDVDQARRCAAAALAEAGSPRQPLTLLAAHRFLGRLAATGEPDTAARHLQVALNLADACAAPHERALTLLASAELAVGTARASATTDAATEARRICLALDAKATLARIDRLDAPPQTNAAPAAPPAGLTRRELEVLRLVAVGMTDAAVGDELGISPRTVGQHLRSTYDKLDVPSRAAATRFAVEHGLA